MAVVLNVEKARVVSGWPAAACMCRLRGHGDGLFLSGLRALEVFGLVLEPASYQQQWLNNDFRLQIFQRQGSY